MATSRNDKAAEAKEKGKTEDENLLEVMDKYTDDLKAGNQLNVVQTGLRLLYRYKTGVVPSIIIAYEVLPYIPLPLRQVVGFTAMNVSVHICDTAHTLCNKEEPLACIRISGKGNMLLGLGKETAKFVTALVPPAIMGLGLGLGLMAYGKDILDSPNPAIQAIGLLLASSMVHVPLTSLISWGVHGGTKSLINEITKSPDVPEKPKPKLNFLQNAGNTAFRPFQPALIYEIMRHLLISNGKDAPLHSPYFSLTVLAFDQVLKFWNHMATIPKPIETLVPEEKKVVVDDGYKHFDDDGNEVFKTITPAAVKAEILSWYGLRMLMAVGAGVLINLALSRLNGDREDMNMEERFMYHAVLILGVAASEMLIDGSSQLWNKLKEKCPLWCPRFFHKPEQLPVVVVVEEVVEVKETTPLVPK
jgi:hypothetical protein